MNIVNATSNKLLTQRIQRVGRLLSGMIMPNIGAYITWGLLAALFIPTGWAPNEFLARLVEPMIIYLLPLLIGYTGGKIVYGQRGGVLGAVVTMGAIVGTSAPMIFGAMVAGPFAGWLIKKIDEVAERRIPSGFEMLVNNFSGGILGGLLAVFAFLGIGPVVAFLSDQLGTLVEGVVAAGALPVASLVVEPAKILFLNNVVNHGVLGPLGITQAAETGQSILFLLETNPGPGLGVLLVYFVFAKGTAKQSAPGAIIIQFFGGIHEVYFPYVLMQPKLIAAVIAGGAAGVLTFSVLGAGLVAVPSPGSIVSLAAMTPKSGLLAVLAGVVISALVTFIIGSFLIDRKAGESSDELTRAKAKMTELKGVKVLLGHDCIPDEVKAISTVKLIAVACDAGMGSSAMGASKLRTVLADAGIDMKVISCPIEQLNSPIDLVITHEQLTKRAVTRFPEAIHIAITDFINTPVYEELAERLAAEKNRLPLESIAGAMSDYQTLRKENIKTGLESVAKEDAIRLAGKILYESGYVEEGYTAAMLRRENEFSTYIGNGAAIPHGTSEARNKIKRTGICILQFPDGVDFGGKTAYLVVGIAAIGDQHLKVLSELARVIEDVAEMDRLRTTSDRDYIHKRFSGQEAK